MHEKDSKIMFWACLGRSTDQIEKLIYHSHQFFTQAKDPMSKKMVSEWKKKYFEGFRQSDFMYFSTPRGYTIDAPMFFVAFIKCFREAPESYLTLVAPIIKFIALFSHRFMHLGSSYFPNIFGIFYIWP